VYDSVACQERKRETKRGLSPGVLMFFIFKFLGLEKVVENEQQDDHNFIGELRDIHSV